MKASPYSLDRDLGLLYYHLDEDWGPLRTRVRRPDGFVVVEEVSGVPCTEFRGLEAGDQEVYLLVKRGVDHFTAIRSVSRVLGARPIYMGVKDANAMTYQLLRVPRGRARHVDSWEGKRMSLRFVGYWRGRLDHTGNRFLVMLEGADEEELRARASRIAEARKLPAYYGYQRFGVRRPNNHLVGMALVEGNAKRAVDLFLGHPYPTEPKAHRRFRELYDAGNYEEALREAPRGLKSEVAALRELVRSGSPVRALRTVPRALLQLFLDAYASYLFNLCLSALIEEGRDLGGLLIEAPPREGSECYRALSSRGLPLRPANPDLLRGLGVWLRRVRRQALMEVRGLRASGSSVEFSLGRGMYATVVLREVLRQDPLTFA